MLKNAPPLFELARRFEEHAKGMVVPGTIFEEFGFNYVGPIDGHDLDSLIPTLENLRDMQGPAVPARGHQEGLRLQAGRGRPGQVPRPGQVRPGGGLRRSRATPPKTTFTQVFGQWLCDMAAADERLVGITPAMREGSGMVEFEQRFPERYLDVGIAEQHAVTFAAGLACEGLKPVVAIYSTFLQRGYDQLIHDVALQNLPVVFALDRAGLVGADGATHAGAYDIAYLRCIPNMSVLAPADENECRQAADHRLPRRTTRWPCATRAAPASAWPIAAELTALPWGKGEVRRQGERIAILAFGTLLYPALAAAEKLDATVANMRFVKPLDVDAGAELARSHEALVTVEEGCTDGRRRQCGAGGAGRRRARRCRCCTLGLPDEFIEHGDPAKLLALCGPGCRRHRAVDPQALRRAAGAGAAVNH